MGEKTDYEGGKIPRGKLYKQSFEPILSMPLQTVCKLSTAQSILYEYMYVPQCVNKSPSSCNQETHNVANLHTRQFSVPQLYRLSSPISHIETSLSPHPQPCPSLSPLPC